MSRGRPRKIKSPDCENATRGYVKRIANELLDHVHYTGFQPPLVSILGCATIALITFIISLDPRVTGDAHMLATQFVIASTIGLVISFEVGWLNDGENTRDASPSSDLIDEIRPCNHIEDDLEDVHAPCSK